ncbi:MAG: AarF/UbiB family protein [Acidimicrobiales bacterium]|nr:AarF/UbiB family protein [Acidimicrobiales bacterium]
MTGEELGVRLASSPWARAEPGLGAAIADLDRDLRIERQTLVDHAAHLARPGPVDPFRAARHLRAMTTARWRWQYGRLPLDLLGGRVLGNPAAYAKATVAGLVRDHLASMGPAAAETARIIETSEGLLPGVLVGAVKARPVRVPPMSRITVEAIVTRALGEAVQAIEAEPTAATPLGQVHRAKLASDGRPVLVRVRRPHVDRDLHADARITASVVGSLERLVPALRDPHPLGFVELAARQTLEEGDLRNEALNAVELALSAEALGLDSVRIPHPIPGLADARAVVLEDIGGVSLEAGSGSFDVERVLRGFLGLSVESALATGVFHADLRAENLVICDDGCLGVIGFGALGCFDLSLRRGALKYLTSIVTGDVEGQIEAMRITDAVPPDVDVAALARDLEASEALQPMQLMVGGEEAMMAGLREGVQLLLRHRLRPPTEITLFVRNLFALNAFVRQVAPESDLLVVLAPLVQLLPAIAAELD